MQSISILIPTQGRLPQLQRLLDGLARVDDRERIPHEIVVINNARDQGSAMAVEAMVRNFSAHEPGRWMHVRELEPGKSCALNSAIPRTTGSILAFLDDDVEVVPSWLRVTWDFFEKYPYDVMQGSIRIPPAMQDDQRFLQLLQRFRTICYYQPAGLEVRPIASLNAANIALRRELLQRTGLFDVRIGPGTSGTSMDVEYGERVLRYGGRIGYEPRSVVYHDVDWSRLTEDYFRRRHQMQGRSRLIYKECSVASVLANLLRARLALGFYSMVGNERKKYRAKGRVFHYGAMLEPRARSAIEKPKTLSADSSSAVSLGKRNPS